MDEVKLVFWGKYIDTYLTETLRRYEETGGGPVDYILVEEKFTRRNIEGDGADNYPNQVTILDQTIFYRQASRILEENRDAVHIFLSFWGDKRLFRVLLKALRHGQRVAVIFEPYSTAPHGYWRDEGRLLSHIKVLGRRIAYRALWPLVRFTAKRHLPCVLAVSPLAEEQLLQMGFPEEVIFPFGYFVERKLVEPAQRKPADALRVLFSGSLIRRKAPDLAIAAVRQVNSAGVRVQLDIYGPGDIDKFLPHIIPGIRYLGTYPQQQAQQVIGAYDLLLVPSRHEGWGLVVNEALLQGVPVIASDRVGAGCLLEASGAGKVFKSGDVAHLASLLADLAAEREELKVLAAACTAIAERITPAIGADYLRSVLIFYFKEKGTRPEAVWLSVSR